ncbi:helix-turn-helix domain-containing protein [Streptomyces broussonetiae]|uniref:Helix-turn-helix domain-containing protein n=1 Tax=Streptomyces broussonetiae TaxID=2686304 RepID=A0ABV5EAB7_9ACTN
MAETQLIAALRAKQGVPRTATRSGVIHVRAYHPNRYTIVGNHLAQHRELSVTAIGLAVHILSLPESAPVDIRTLAERFPEGRDRIAFALRELEACGYPERVRERTAEGRMVTRTYVHHRPGEPAVADAVADDTDVVPAPAPVVREPAPLPEPEPEPRRGPSHERAVSLLAGLRRTDERLTLSRREVERLAPVVAEWLEGGASAATVHRTLTADLPGELRSASALVGYRLRESLPPPLPAVPVFPAPGVGRSRPHPFQDCDGCDRVFRAPEPGLCRSCRAERLPVAGVPAVA